VRASSQLVIQVYKNLEESMTNALEGLFAGKEGFQL